MNNQERMSAPLRNAVYGFLLVALAMLAISMLRKASLIEEYTTRRALGFSLGILMTVAGNYLPKTRFLKTRRWTSPSAAAAERLIGWAFVLAGAVNACAFATVPLSLARSISACLAAILLLTVLGAALALRIGPRPAAEPDNLQVVTEPSTGQPKIGLALLVALIWVLISASMKYFWDDVSWSQSPVLAVIYIGLFDTTVIPFLQSSRRRKPGRRFLNG